MKALLELIAAHSVPESVVRSEQYAGGRMIHVVFSDGEISCTKAGSLLWQRNLHCFEPGVEGKKIPGEHFPAKYAEYGIVFVEEGEHARALSRAIKEVLAVS